MPGPSQPTKSTIISNKASCHHSCFLLHSLADIAISLAATSPSSEDISVIPPPPAKDKVALAAVPDPTTAGPDSQSSSPLRIKRRHLHKAGERGSDSAIANVISEHVERRRFLLGSPKLSPWRREVKNMVMLRARKRRAGRRKARRR